MEKIRIREVNGVYDVETMIWDDASGIAVVASNPFSELVHDMKKYYSAKVDGLVDMTFEELTEKMNAINNAKEADFSSKAAREKYDRLVRNGWNKDDAIVESGIGG